MARVITERYRGTILRTNAAMRAQDEDFLSPEFLRIPSHARVLRKTKQIAGRPREQHLRSDRQASLRAFRFRSDFVECLVGRIGEDLGNIIHWHFHDISAACPPGAPE